MKKMFFVIVLLVFLLVPTLAHGQVFGDVGIHRVVFPQFAYGGGWTTTILVTNTSNSTAQVTVGFTVAGGSNALVPITRRDGSIAMIGAYNPGDIPPKGSWTNTLRSESLDITTGYINAMVNMVNGKDTLQVQVTYTLHSPNGSVESQAAVFSSNPTTNSSLQVVRPGVGSDMGVAIANLNFVPANVNLKIHNMAGEVVASVSLVVQPKDQVSKFLTELAPELKTTWTGGLITVTSDQEVSTLGLITTVGADGRFTFSTAGTVAQ